MGRKKSDSPTLFPWDKLFSDDENTFNQGLDYCKSDYSGSETLKRAVTAIGSGYNSGSKPVLCDRIKQKANQIRYQINKVQNAVEREELRTRVVDYYTQTFLKKFEGKEPDIVNIVIPPRPDLPALNEQEKRRYASPPSSPRSSPPSSPRAAPRAPPAFDLDDDEDIPMPQPRAVPRKEEIFVNDGSLLAARAILYYKNAPLVDGKKKLSAKSFYEQLVALYSGVVSNDSPLLNKDNIKAEITKIPGMIKATGGYLKKEVVDKAESVVKKSEGMREYIRNIDIEIDEEDIPMPPPRAAPRQEPPQVEIYQSSVTEDEIMNYIKTKGWEEPTHKSKEALCDYVLRKIKTEDVKSENEYKSIEDRIEKLSTNLITLIEMQEERIKALEKANKALGSKGKKKVTFGPDQVKIIEDEVEEIQEQIHDVKEQLQEAMENKEEIVQEQEEKKQMCFRMRQWLDQDEFDRVEAEKDLVCDTGVCNVESGVCESSVDGEYTSTIGIAKIKGSKDNVDRIYNQFNKPIISPVVEPDEEIPMVAPMVPRTEVKQKKAKIPTETLRQQIKLILSTSDLDSVTSKDVIQQLSMFFKVKFDKRKDEIKAIITEEFDNLREEKKEEEPLAVQSESYMSSIYKTLNPEHGLVSHNIYEEPIKEVVEPEIPLTEQQIVEKTVEFLEASGKKINEKAIRAQVGEFFNIDITPHKALIKTTVKQFVEDMKGKRKRCNTIPLEQDVDEETRAQDLMCGDGEACNLDESRCDPIEELTEPVEELTIGGMLVKVSGKNKIIEALRQKIINSGGAIPVEESGAYEPEEIPEMTEELPEEIPEESIVEPAVTEPERPSVAEQSTPLAEVIEESEEANDVFQSSLPGVRINLQDLINNIKSITKSSSITSAQNKIKSAERKCIDRIAKCAGIKL